MRSDEIALAKGLLPMGAYHENRGDVDRTPRGIIADAGIPPKRGWYVLGKWAGKGWYDWGVSIDLGWLNPEGVEALAARIQGDA